MIPAGSEGTPAHCPLSTVQRRRAPVITAEIALALHYLHQHQWIYRDLKPGQGEGGGRGRRAPPWRPLERWLGQRGAGGGADRRTDLMGTPRLMENVAGKNYWGGRGGAL